MTTSVNNMAARREREQKNQDSRFLQWGILSHQQIQDLQQNQDQLHHLIQNYTLYEVFFRTPREETLAGLERTIEVFGDAMQPLVEGTCTYLDPQEPPGTLGDPHGPLETLGDPQEPPGTLGDPHGPLETPRDPQEPPVSPIDPQEPPGTSGDHQDPQ
ncbi:ciliary-associated calcium-binding coiled-coil protein 1 isoform X2 [Cololabis saira]|uniref:ciliary-associated calcium-binding coiled-coil protein 1 isoform X2 n=1 Tax=Cololabis saira TaxID=129043 RepID=UPI002AD29F13|nr:ciliary-associated calcium-binding coiled-coil protein 1 isoform X2 [Cololabis saira]